METNIIDFMRFYNDNNNILKVEDLSKRIINEILLSCQLHYFTHIKFYIEKHYNKLQIECEDITDREYYFFIFIFQNEEYYIYVTKLVFYMLYIMLDEINFQFELDGNFSDTETFNNEMNFMLQRADRELLKLYLN